MNKKRFVNIMVTIGLLTSMLSACKPEPDKNILYVNLTWHQHQPLYYKDDNGIYSRPWVRAHATKDYLDMAETVAKYEDVHITFNLTPSLIRQLDDYSENGAKDIYWTIAEKPVSDLQESEKRFMLERFFDANWDHIIRIYPRYSELLDKRGGSDEVAINNALEAFTEQDLRDLQIWFNLAWIDPDYLALEPLKSLVQKGKDFSEEDKPVLFGEISRLISEVVPKHAELQDAGVIEVTTTPYAHPILPLIFDTNLALVGNPGAEMPERFSYPQDAVYHLEKSVEIYESHFDQDVRGLWPGEGSVAQDVVGIISDAGYKWMQTGEPVLAKSLGIDAFTRDGAEMVLEADDIYRPYYVKDGEGEQVAVFFRDWNLSDKIGFTYSGMLGTEAASDLVNHLEAIQTNFVTEGVEGPHVVTLVIDGENAWENYDNDGKEFLNTLYELFSESETLKTVTPSEYLDMFPEQRTLDNLFPGAWFSPNYDTWIGESEEAFAWDYLEEVRAFLSDYENGIKTADEGSLATAFDYMYLAEGSDWFWWYGTDQDSGQDTYFDQGFRELLIKVYESLEEEIPSFLSIPIVQPQPIKADIPLMGSGTPDLDGEGIDDAWTWAAFYEGTDVDLLKGLYFILDDENLYLRIDAEKDTLQGKDIEFYINIPGEEGRTSFGYDQAGQSDMILGMSATTLVRWNQSDGKVKLYDTDGINWSLIEDNIGAATLGQKVFEVGIPLEKLGDLKTGDDLRLLTLVKPDERTFPSAGPVQIVILDMGEATSLLVVDDPEGDDTGTGSYTYPLEGIFIEQAFDIKSFEISYDSTSLIFTMTLYGAIENAWNSPSGFSIQTFDVYIDKDSGSSTGARMLLPGRNAALAKENGWEYAIWVEGWYAQVVIPDEETLEPKDYSEASSGMKLFVDPGKNAIIARVPLIYLGEGDPSSWSYAAVLLGQEGYPATGVWRVRDIGQVADQFKFGGALADNNHTRIIDMVWPEDAVPTQEEIIGGYLSSAKPIDVLSPDDFVIIPLIEIK